MAKSYTNLFEVVVDFNLYLGEVKGNVPPLAYFAAVAKNRWKWLTENWNTYYPRFKGLAAGNERIEANLSDFNNAVTSYKLGNPQNALESNVNYVKFLPFLANVSLGELTLTPQEVTFVRLERDRVSKFDITDFRNMLGFLKSSIADASSFVGKGDVDGAKVFGGQSVRQQRESTFEDFQQIALAIQLEQYVEGVVFALRQKQDRPPNLLTLSSQNVDANSSVAINTNYQSYISVPFQDSLENMADLYLGDRRLWFELATVNNLQPPYIDEIGTKYSLLTPGGVNTVTVLATDSSNIQVGQRLRVGSLKFKEEGRIIERKVENNDGSITLALSGEQNLNLLKPAEGAYIRAYKPGTVNGSSMILIPLDVRAVNAGGLTPQSDGLRRLDRSLLAFGIDIQRDEKTGDLLIDSTGNFKLAVGLPNIRQTILNLLKTRPGELPFHPEYGFGVNIGAVYFGTQEELVILSEIIIGNILRDPRFTDAEVTRIKSLGNAVAIDVLIKVEGSDAILPLSFVA